MRYALPAIAVNEEELDRVQAGALAVILQRLGFSSKLPKAIRHGSAQFGGLGLYDLRTELGIAQIKFFRESVITGKEPGKLLLISLQHSQREAGIMYPLLERPDIHIPYLTPTWITSLRQYLYNHNITISLTDTYELQLNGKNDQSIMNLEYLKGYTTGQQAQINRVRIHLQVATLSDMSDDTGFCIRPEYLAGDRPSNFQVCTQWPHQPTVTRQQQRLWRKYVGSHFLRYGTKWINRLERPNTTGNIESTTHTPNPTQYSSLALYLKSLPRWHQRLLHSYTQCASDVDIWRTFRSKKRVTIVSDGGLADEIGTFGWKLIGASNETLYAGAGPIDGPPELGSSTRSELGGLVGTPPSGCQL
jgi:hypothetical protein